MTGKTAIASNGGNVLIISTMFEEGVQVLFDLRWMLVLIVVLILCDFWFGVSSSIQQGKQFRFSRAGRRTCNKAVDYISYLMLGAILGLGIFEPLGIASHTTTAAVGLGLGMIWEIDSIVGHVCSLHGIESRFSVKKLLIALIKKKDSDLGEAIEESVEDAENNKPDKK